MFDKMNRLQITHRSSRQHSEGETRLWITWGPRRWPSWRPCCWCWLPSSWPKRCFTYACSPASPPSSPSPVVSEVHRVRLSRNSCEARQWVIPAEWREHRLDMSQQVITCVVVSLRGISGFFKWCMTNGPIEQQAPAAKYKIHNAWKFTCMIRVLSL